MRFLTFLFLLGLAWFLINLPVHNESYGGVNITAPILIMFGFVILGVVLSQVYNWINK